MAFNEFEDDLVLAQLSTTTSVLEIIGYGYSTRISFVELHNMYQSFLSTDLRKLDPRTFIRMSLRPLAFNSADYKLGKTEILFKPDKFMQFDQMIKKDPEILKQALEKRQVILSRFKKMVFCVLFVIKSICYT